jgi:hypothetical protein
MDTPPHIDNRNTLAFATPATFAVRVGAVVLKVCLYWSTGPLTHETSQFGARPRDTSLHCALRHS